jgi:hypothetical protein
MNTSWQRRWRAKHGDFAVPCIVTSRWIEFSQVGSTPRPEGEAIKLAVMTDGSNDEPHKICELIVTREELLRVLALIEKTV